MDFKIINENNKTNRIYLQDEIEQNIFKIKNLSLDKSMYRSFSELWFYKELNMIHFPELIEYKLEKSRDNMRFSNEELEKEKYYIIKKRC